MSMTVKFPKTKVSHRKCNKDVRFIYSVGPNNLKTIDFGEALCIWGAVEYALMKRKGC